MGLIRMKKVRGKAAEAMVGAGPSWSRRVRSAPHRKVTPLDLMVRAPSSEADATWMALVSRLRMRIKESPITYPSNSSSKLPKKDLFVANAIGVRRAMAGRSLSGMSPTRAQRRGVESLYGPRGRVKGECTSCSYSHLFKTRESAVEKNSLGLKVLAI